MTSSEKRREVAEKLRHASHTDANLDLTIAIAILETIGEVRRPIAAVVADLIDPTCEVVGRAPLYMDDETEFLLSCGHVADMVTDCPPAFCPKCGARVVDDADGEDE